MRNMICSVLFVAAKLALCVAAISWIVGHWQVFGVAVGPFSFASGPGGWEISRWTVPDRLLPSFFCYPENADATDSISKTPRLWGIFVYHWLVVGMLIFAVCVLRWACRTRGKELAVDE